MKYKIQRIPGGYSASLHVPLGEGREVVFSASAYEHELKEEMESRVGFINLKKIGRSLNKLTKSKALRKAVRTATGVVKSPALSATLMAVNPALGIGLQSTLQGLDAAEKLLGNATKAPKGSRKRIAARTLIKASRLAAAQPDPQAQILQLLQSPLTMRALPLPTKGATRKRSGKTRARKAALNYLSQLMSL